MCISQTNRNVEPSHARAHEQRYELSASDIEQINRLYGCKTSGIGKTPTTTPEPTEPTFTRPGGEVCEDKHALCKEYKAKDMCEKEAEYMLSICCLTCGGNNLTMASTTSTDAGMASNLEPSADFQASTGCSALRAPPSGSGSVLLVVSAVCGWFSFR